MYHYRLYLIILLLLFSVHKSGAQETNFSTKNVEFESEGVTLKGTIFNPKKPYAALVVVHGSGQEKRMIQFASLLANHGMMVLTYDKRGVGESGGVYAGPEVGTNNIDSANLNLLAMDASAATNLLLKHLPAKHIPVGLIGYSQAGWIIPIAAEKNSKVNFMVLFSGPVVTAREQLRFQFFTQGKSDFWELNTESESRKHIQNDPDKYQFVDTDPRDALAKLSIPGLWLFGVKDVQIPTKLSTEHIDEFKSVGKPFEYKLFPTLGHNTTFEASPEPFNSAIRWIKAIGNQKTQNTN
ncbi:alpha/beta hydrolase family protein [Pedobacter jejuensis]|uniref:Alpha/beta hydrolase n=1 Tax=Pedobacter jejuensis TaxID=1268550 RepID=A0A3N0BP62_9SPHI|nr:alpha/beta hydrolase [Pedobacter jejuensis]RNL50680.1 alpha/beta hydrolase [Pedobacter jejuensis]